MDVYRLLTGKITRKNADGVMETHRAPYDFTPTESEFSANKFRMRLVKRVADAAAVDIGAPVSEAHSTPGVANNTIPAAVPENTRVENICSLSAKAAVAYVEQVTTDEELDRLFFQECDNKPKVRESVLKSIDYRRNQLKDEKSARTEAN